MRRNVPDITEQINDELAEISKARQELTSLLMKLDQRDPIFQETIAIIAAADALCAEIRDAYRTSHLLVPN